MKYSTIHILEILKSNVTKTLLGFHRYSFATSTEILMGTKYSLAG